MPGKLIRLSMNNEVPHKPTHPHAVDRERLDRLAWWLDERFEIPVIKMRVGLDSIIGLLPVVGDVVTTAVSGYLIVQARRAGAPKPLIGKMLGNVAIDLLSGLIPVIGDVADMAVRANRANMDLLNAHLDELEEKPKPQKQRMWLLLLIAALAGLAIYWYQNSDQGPVQVGSQPQAIQYEWQKPDAVE